MENRNGLLVRSLVTQADAVLWLVDLRDLKRLTSQAKMSFRAAPQMATTAGCLIFRSSEIA